MQNTNELFLKILLGDGKGMVNYVHFILSGKCRLIEHMLVRERSSYRGTQYELYDPENFGPQEQSREILKETEEFDEFESHQLDQPIPVRIKKRKLLNLYNCLFFP